jgi:hypothetical protein
MEITDLRPRAFMLALVLLISACSTVEKRKAYEPARPAPTSAPAVAPAAPAKVEEIIDLRALQTSLRMDIPKTKLGYREKKFNTCNVGAGYSSKQNCRAQTLVVIHFKLMCRDSEGTVSEAITQAYLQPIANQNIKWRLSTAEAEILSDSDGFAQIVLISTYSQRKERLRLTTGNDFLALRAGEVSSIIAPQNWCQWAGVKQLQEPWELAWDL